VTLRFGFTARGRSSGTGDDDRRASQRCLFVAQERPLSYPRMGVLDEAIREHLELKRLHGAPEAEIAKDAAEALGPARRDAATESSEAGVGEPDAPPVDAPTQFLAGGDLAGAESSPTPGPPDVMSDRRPRGPGSVPPPPDPGGRLREPDPASVPPPPPPPPPGPGAGAHDPDLRPVPPLREEDIAEHEADSAFAPPSPPPSDAAGGLTEPHAASVPPAPLHEEESWESVPPEDEPPDEAIPHSDFLDSAPADDIDEDEPVQRPLEVFGDEPSPAAPPPSEAPSDETQLMDLPDLWLGEQMPPGERPPLDERVRRARAEEEANWREADDQADEEAPPHRPRRDRPDELDFDQ
jgi:hypothetical protein